jgi:hypothetical protein
MGPAVMAYPFVDVDAYLSEMDIIVDEPSNPTFPPPMTPPPPPAPPVQNFDMVKEIDQFRDTLTNELGQDVFE